MIPLGALPKVDLHLHLDGALRPASIRAMALEAGAAWPPGGEEMCRVRPDCRSLVDFLATFDFFLPFLSSRQALRRAARELCEDQAADGVIYFEARFAPTLWEKTGLSAEAAVEGALEGLIEGAAGTGVRWGLILCGLRNTDPARTMTAVELAHRFRSRGVVGIDIAGDERAPLAPHAPAFREAEKLGIPFTIHAGEAGPAANVTEALSLGAARIGHGVRVVEDPAAVALAMSAAATFEMCLTSNLMTHAVGRIEDHPFPRLLREGHRVTLNTDDPGVQGTTLTQDYELARRAFGLRPADFRETLRHSIDAAWAGEALKRDLRVRIEAAWGGLA